MYIETWIVFLSATPVTVIAKHEPQGNFQIKEKVNACRKDFCPNYIEPHGNTLKVRKISSVKYLALGS